jgi:peroxiredoxin family protein
VNVEDRGGLYKVTLKKGKSSEGSQIKKTKKKTFLMFSGDLDKAFAGMVMANGARAMGNDVTLFFAFWGINILRNSEFNKPVEKSFLDKMFGMMMPKGAFVMKEKKVDSLPVMIKQALDSGIKMVACSMSMDVMGITKEELIDGVEIGGVAHFLSEAETSDVSFMI